MFHHVGEDYLPQYLNEFEYRLKRREVHRVDGSGSGAASVVLPDSSAGESARLGVLAILATASANVYGATFADVSSCFFFVSLAIASPPLSRPSHEYPDLAITRDTANAGHVGMLYIFIVS